MANKIMNTLTICKNTYEIADKYARNSIDNLNTEVDGLNTEVDGLNTEVDNLNTEVDGLNTEVDNLNTEVDGLNTETSSLNTKINNLNTEVDGLKNIKPDITLTKSGQAADAKVVGDAINQLNTEISDAGSIDIDFDISNEAEVNPINADTLGGLLASDYAKQVDLNNLKNNLENLDTGLHMELLWKNASPNSSFAAQVINIALSDYAYIGIDYVMNTSNKYRMWAEFAVGCTGAISLVHVKSADPSVHVDRCFVVNETNIEFYDAYMAASTNSAVATHDYAVPIKIYGIKGVSA